MAVGFTKTKNPLFPFSFSLALALAINWQAEGTRTLGLGVMLVTNTNNVRVRNIFPKNQSILKAEGAWCMVQDQDKEKSWPKKRGGVSSVQLPVGAKLRDRKNHRSLDALRVAGYGSRGVDKPTHRWGKVKAKVN